MLKTLNQAWYESMNSKHNKQLQKSA